MCYGNQTHDMEEFAITVAGRNIVEEVRHNVTIISSYLNFEETCLIDGSFYLWIDRNLNISH